MKATNRPLRWASLATAILVCALGASRSTAQYNNILAYGSSVLTVPGTAAAQFDGPILEDFTGDGTKDALFLFGPPTTLVLLTGASGAVSLTTSQAPGLSENILAGAADVNQDGLLDVIACGGGVCTAGPCPPGSILVFLNSGNGSFYPASYLPSAPLAGREGFAVSDLNGDGITEVVVVGLAPQGGSVLAVYSIDPATAAFAPAFFHPFFAAQMSAVALGDFDGNGKQDIGVGATAAGHVGVLYQQPNFVFSALTVAGLPQPPNTSCFYCAGHVQQLAAGDFDGNGVDDLIVRGVWASASGASSALWVVPAPLGTIPVTALQGFSLGAYGHRIVVADLDLADGGVPEVIIDTFLLRFSLTATGALTSGGVQVPTYSFGELSQATVDLDADGDLDIVGAYRVLSADPACQHPCTDIDIQVIANQTLTAAGCGGPQGAPWIGAGISTMPNPAFAITLSGAAPGVPAALAISTDPGAVIVGPCLVGLDLSHLVFPLGSLAITTTNASGAAAIPLPIPYDWFLSNSQAFAQWIVSDPSGPLVIGAQSFALTKVRKMVLF